MRLCQACGAEITSPERIGRRDTCLRCGADLHACRSCRFYVPGHHNDCLESQAERVVDKMRGNFCDYFSFREGGAGAAAPVSEARGALEALFRKRS